MSADVSGLVVGLGFPASLRPRNDHLVALRCSRMGSLPPTGSPATCLPGCSGCKALRRCSHGHLDARFALEFVRNAGCRGQQIGADGMSYPIQGTEYIHAKANSDGSTSLVAAHAIVPAGSPERCVDHVQLKLPAAEGALDPHCTRSWRCDTKTGPTTLHFGGRHNEDSRGHDCRADQPRQYDREAGCNQPGAGAQRAPASAGAEATDNPGVLATVFAGSTGEPVSLVDPETGLEAPHIVCSHAAATSAANQLSENMQAPFGHYGLEFQTHVVDGTVDDDDTATLNLSFNRAAMTMDGHEGGALHASDVANKIGVSLARPDEPVSKAKKNEYKDAFSAGLFKAPVKSSVATPPSTVVTLGGGDEGAGSIVVDGNEYSDEE